MGYIIMERTNLDNNHETDSFKEIKLSDDTANDKRWFMKIAKSNLDYTCEDLDVSCI